MTPRLIELLSKGNLGPLALGMDLSAILDVLGVSDHYENLDQLRSTYRERKVKAGPDDVFFLWYGLLQIMILFENDKMIHFKIFFPHDNGRLLPSTIDDGWVGLLAYMPRDQFKNVLKTLKLKSKRILYSDSMNEWVTKIWIPQSGVLINFDTEDQNDQLVVVEKAGEELIAPNQCSDESKCEEFT